MYHLAQAPRREPFSDWKARVERIILKRTGFDLTLQGFGLQSYYDVGVSPDEAPIDWIGTRR